jgi:mannitol-specific phosphotransferase system IIBC component
MQVEPPTEPGLLATPYVPPGPLESFFSEIIPWLAIVIPPIIGYFGGRSISRIHNTIMRFLFLAAFIVAPIILWFTAAYADGCWPNSLGIGRERCMWVGFGLLVFTVPFVLYIIAAIAGYITGRKRAISLK